MLLAARTEKNGTLLPSLGVKLGLGARGRLGQEFATMPTAPALKENVRSYIGRYRLLAHIATGGMGIIYKARDEETAQPASLKILVPALPQKPTTSERFRRPDARYVLRRHHHIV